MHFRLLHTSDWHLGQQLHQWSRQEEHQAFLSWLGWTLKSQKIDALIIAGDVFDVSNPPATAVHDLFHFLATTRREMPRLDIVIIGGNHDSASRLNSSNPILNALNIHVIGGIPRTEQGQVDYAAMCIPLHNDQGKVAAWCGAMPFIRMADLGSAALAGGASLLDAYKNLHNELVQHLRNHAGPDHALILTGHAFMRGGLESPDSERRLAAGTLLGLPIDIFPAGIHYVALGHLHRAQTVADRQNIRYSGAPIPLSLPESENQQSCCLITFQGKQMTFNSLEIPRHTEMLRIPAQGPAALEELTAEIKQLPDKKKFTGPYPFLELRVLLEKPQPGLHRDIQALLEGKAVRLVKISPTYPERKQESSLWSGTRLSELNPSEVLQRYYQQNFEQDPPQAVLSLFERLVETCRQQEDA